ncbi:MAG: hypothetical protein RJB04_628 [Verrucomicrobiota bacterium]|jgi:hypothetical protein
MNPLETRKRLLMAESDLLRIQLTEDIESLRSAWDRSGSRARIWSGLISSIPMLMAGMSALHPKPTADGGSRRSWGTLLLQGAGLLSTVWLSWKRARSGPSR